MSYERRESCSECSPPVRPAIGSCGEQLAMARSESVTDEGDDEDCISSAFMVFVRISGFTA